MTAALATREDFFQVGAREVFARGANRPPASRISPGAVFAEGTDINIILAASAAMADEATRHLAIRMAALYLDSAEGLDLDRLVADRFGPEIARKQAGPSVVVLTFSRPSPPSLLDEVEFRIGHKARTSNGTEFEIVQPFSFPAGSTGPIEALAQAAQAGRGGNVSAGQIVELLGFGEPSDSSIVVTNLEPATGGADVEQDDSLRERARDFYRTSRRGTLPAIEFGAMTVQGVFAATAEEVLDVNGLPNGMVRVWPADVDGKCNAAMAEAVRAAIRNYRCAGIPVDVLTTTPDFQEIRYSLAFRSGTNTKAAVAQLKAITNAVVNLLAPQEPLQRSLLFALARSVPGAIVTDQSVQLPAGDLQPQDGSVIKTSLSRIFVNGL